MLEILSLTISEIKSKKWVIRLGGTLNVLVRKQKIELCNINRRKFEI